MNQSEHGGIDFSEELQKLDEAYKATPVLDSNGRIPDGKYQMRIMSAVLGRSKTSNMLMVTMKLKIEGPSLIGTSLFRHTVVAHDKLEYLKRDLSRLGVNLEKLSDLPSALPALHGVLFEATAKVTGEFQNIYVDRKVNEGAPSSFGGGFGSDAPPQLSSSIPF